MSDCYPEPTCRCCTCQNIHCMLFHKGHNHRFDDLQELMDKGLEEWHDRIIREIYRTKDEQS